MFSIFPMGTLSIGFCVHLHTSNILRTLIKFILLLARRQSKKIIDCLISFICHSEKGIIETVNRSVSYDKTRQRIKKQRHHFANKGSYSQSYDFFFSSYVQMWELDHKESGALKNWCYWTVVLEKNPESLLDSKEIKTVNTKEINPEYSLEGLMLKLMLQYFGHLIWRANPLEKTLRADPLEKILRLGKTEGKRRMRAAEDEIVR